MPSTNFATVGIRKVTYERLKKLKEDSGAKSFSDILDRLIHQTYNPTWQKQDAKKE
jgi:predicted CopG family antitoxin